MIQIIENGKPLKKYKVVYTISCPNCGCKFSCEKEDFKAIDREPNGLHTIDCPWCEHELQMRPSSMTTDLIAVPDDVPVPSPIKITVPDYRLDAIDCDSCPFKPDPSKWWVVGDTPCTFCKKLQPTCISKEK